MIKEPMWRLKADEGYILTDGTDLFPAIDIAPNDDPDRIMEIEIGDDNNEEDFINE